MCQEEELLKLDLKIANSGYGDDAWLLCSLLRNWSGTDKWINRMERSETDLRGRGERGLF